MKNYIPKDHLRKWQQEVKQTSISIYEGADKYEVFRGTLLDDYVARTVYSVVEKLKAEGKQHIIVEYTERTHKQHSKMKFLMTPKYRVYQRIKIN